MKTFRRDGIEWGYPLNWTLDVEADGEGGTGWTATATSPQTAFFLACLRPDIADPAELATTTLETMQVEYSTLEPQEVIGSLAGRPAIGYDIDFITVDVTSFTMIRCMNTAYGVLLVLAQVADYDREYHEPVLREMLASVRIHDEDDHDDTKPD